jgi:sodium/proline symporter
MISPSIVAFLCYFAILLTIGLVSHHRQKSATDFIVGNRSLNFWLTALSAHASDMSAWLFMGLPAAVFLYGMNQIWIPIGLIAGMFLNWTFVAKKLREETANLKCVTLSSFFEKKYPTKSGIIRILTAVMMLIYLTAYLSAGLMAMGLLLESIFEMNYFVGLTIATFVAVFYTFYGGFVTIAWTDMFQALFLLAVILFLPLWAAMELPGGIPQTIDSIQAIHPLSFENITLSSIFSAVALILGWGIGYFGQPHIITKFMGINDANELKKSRFVGMSWQIAALAASVCVGLVGVAYFPMGLANPELVTVQLVHTLFHPFFGGVILCAILAANISTMDSQVLVAASMLSEDLWCPIFSPKASEKKLLLVSRIGVLLVAVFSLLVAFYKSAAILKTVLYAWSGLGSAFGPLVLMSLYSKKTNQWGAIAGIVVGGVVSGIWPLLNPHIISMEISPLFPGFFLSLGAIVLVSALTKKD